MVCMKSRTLSFGLAGLLVVLMMAATGLEKKYGTDFAVRHIYASPYFVLCWGAMAVCSISYLVRRRVWKRTSVFLLHVAFLVILSGAFLTHLTGYQGSVRLRLDAGSPVTAFTARDGTAVNFPFLLSLEDFRLEYYPGTSAPMDYVSTLAVREGGKSYQGEVAMNRVHSHRHYRFYQSGYDSDGRGATLSVSYDPWGIAVTYTGYGLLLLSFCLFFFGKGSEFRRLLRHPALKSAATCLFFALAFAGNTQAKELPRALPRATAEKFGHLYIYYNDRICPLQTLAKDFTLKLCGRTTYKGLTAEQVLTGWFFYYDSWKEEPCIRVKSKEVCRLLGIDGEYARLTDFIDVQGYIPDRAMQSATELKDRQAWEEANEKFSLVSMVAAGSVWKLFPYIAAADSLSVAGAAGAATGNKRMTWYSLADRLPPDMSEDVWLFVRNCMNYVAEQVAREDFRAVEESLDKIRKYQVREAGDFLPSQTRFKAELWYNALNGSRPFALSSLAIGIWAFLYYCRRMIRRKTDKTPVTAVLLAGLAVILFYLTVTIVLSGIVSGHAPMSNGYETMRLLAALTALLTFFFYRKMPVAIAFGYLLCGLSLLVSMLGEANPKITLLMPVLSSPLLSLHVMVIMLAYSLLAFMMLNGITAVVLHLFHPGRTGDVERLQVISRIILYPVVFLLAVGIFIGAVWANVSWGRYWGWDPKEVWALITMLIYASALHPASLPAFRRPMFFHIFAIAAFFSVLITYFGVNFFLGGIHAYAG